MFDIISHLLKHITFEEYKENGLKKMIPILQNLHNNGLFNYDLSMFKLEGGILNRAGSLAIDWLKEKASSPNYDALSMRKLGICYEFGFGTSEDFTEAIKWYELAANHGDEYSAIMVAHSCMYMTKEYKKARHYLKMVKHDKGMKKEANNLLQFLKIKESSGI